MTVFGADKPFDFGTENPFVLGTKKPQDVKVETLENECQVVQAALEVLAIDQEASGVDSTSNFPPSFWVFVINVFVRDISHLGDKVAQIWIARFH